MCCSSSHSKSKKCQKLLVNVRAWRTKFHSNFSSCMLSSPRKTTTSSTLQHGEVRCSTAAVPACSLQQQNHLLPKAVFCQAICSSGREAACYVNQRIVLGAAQHGPTSCQWIAYMNSTSFRWKNKKSSVPRGHGQAKNRRAEHTTRGCTI